MATGTAILNFGAFPGASDASVNVTGQAAIVAGSLVEAWLRPVATADHTADEHMLETLKVFAGNIVAATGFTIYGFNTSQLNEPVREQRYGTGLGRINAAEPAPGNADQDGLGTRLYGQWTVAWAWV